jgi:hypothetical protein
MFVHHKNATKRLITFMVVGFVFAIFASSASADCGTPFTNKATAVNYYKHNPGAASMLKKWLSSHKVYEFHADQGLNQYLEQSNVRVFNAPSGYVLDKNTYCPNGPNGGYSDYTGNKGNMSGRPMLWFCNKAGKCFPILKGYCRNAVKGPPVVKHPPKKKPPKKKPPKCKCHHKHKKPKKPSCEAMGMITVAGNCVQQSNNAKQECEAKVGGTWNGNQCSIIQINANCSNVVVGNEPGSTVNQGGNCNTTIEEGPCCSPPPCECKPPEEPKTLVVEWERIQESYTNEIRHLCVTVTPAAGAEVQFGVKYGERSNGGKGVYNASTNKYCVTYTAPSEEPPHVCEEAIATNLPPGTKCDIANVQVTCDGCKPVTAKMEIPILKEETQVVW